MVDSISPLNETSATAFGRAWADCWNRGDFEAVLAHFSDDCVFESPFAEKHSGSTRVEGKAALRAYWAAAVASVGRLHFEVDFVAHSTSARALTIVYRATLGERTLHACEQLMFGPAALVTRGIALYGPPVV